MAQAKSKIENGLESPAPYESAPMVDDSERIGIPVKFIALEDNSMLIDKRKVLLDNFEAIEVALEQAKQTRKLYGQNSLNRPVVFYATVVQSASSFSPIAGYAVRVASLKTHAGQGHVTAVKRLLDLGHAIVGHDLPSVEAFTEMKEKGGARDLSDMIGRFKELRNFVEEQIDITFNRKSAVTSAANEAALKSKIKELEAKIKSEAK